MQYELHLVLGAKRKDPEVKMELSVAGGVTAICLDI